MDFIDLANDMSAVTQSLLRHLTVSQEGDDDFARLDGEYHAAAAQQAVSSAQPQPDGYNYAPGDPSVQLKQPLLSPTAEAELYLLATNFLLCKQDIRISTMPFFLCVVHFSLTCFVSCQCRCCHGHYHYNGCQNLFS